MADLHGELDLALVTQTRQKNPSLLLSIGMDKGDSDVVVFECMCEGFPCGMGGSPGTVDK